MAGTEDNQEMAGIARSIDALFSEDGGSESTGEKPSDPPVIIEEDAPEAADAEPPPESDDLTWEEVVEEGGEVLDDAPSVDPDPDALAKAVDRYLASPPLDRDGQASEIREMVAALREANALDPLANAVERLVLETGDPPDEACLAIAHSMVSAGVASRIVARLGAERDEDRRARLLVLCQRIGHEMAAAVSDALSDTTDRFARRVYMDTMISMGQTGRAVVEEMLEDGRWFVVRNGVAILGEVGGDRAVELVTSTLAHTEGKVRREALLALAKIGGEDAGMLVYGMLEDPDPDVRLAAAMAAGALRVERALKPLLSIVEDESDPDVLVGVLGALGQLGDPGAVNSIEKHAVGSFFSKSPPEVRIAAYRALHRIGTPHARRLLNQAVDDKNLEVKAAARQLLGMR
jgi:HEAT repeats